MMSPFLPQALACLLSLASALSFPGLGAGAELRRNSSKFIIIASGQRSASTELGVGLGRANPCVWNLNEFFNDGPGQTGAGYLMDPSLFATRRQRALEALDAAHAGACAEIDRARTLRGEPACGLRRCAVAVKLFSSHLVPSAEVSRLFADAGSAVVVLERDAVQRHCSLKFAHQQGDWATAPVAGRSVPCHACRTERCRVVRSAFVEDHAAWFAFVRCAAAAAASSRGSPALEVPFAEWTDPAKSSAVLRAVLDLGSGAGVDAGAVASAARAPLPLLGSCAYDGEWRHRAKVAAALHQLGSLPSSDPKAPREPIAAAPREEGRSRSSPGAEYQGGATPVAAAASLALATLGPASDGGGGGGGGEGRGRRGSSARQRPVFFMHLHKAAGSSLCELAVANRVRAAGVKSLGTKELGFNCNLLGDDPGHLGLGVHSQASTCVRACVRCARRKSPLSAFVFDWARASREKPPNHLKCDREHGPGTARPRASSRAQHVPT